MKKKKNANNINEYSKESSVCSKFYLLKARSECQKSLFVVGSSADWKKRILQHQFNRIRRVHTIAKHRCSVTQCD